MKKMYYVRRKDNTLIVDDNFDRLVDTIEITPDLPEPVEIKDCTDEDIAVIKDQNYLKEEVLEELEEEHKRILGEYKMYKKDFVKIISKKYHVSYKEFMDIIEANEDALIEWDMAEDNSIQRNSELFNLVDLGINKSELDKIFEENHY